MKLCQESWGCLSWSYGCTTS